MIKILAQAEVQDFILKNQDKDPRELALKKSSFKGLAMSEIAAQIAAKQRIKNKLPSWYNKVGLIFPPTLNLEQSSSELTAQYKADLISNTLEMGLDMTGGLGIDSLAFSKKIKEFTYCELNKDLFLITEHNFEIWGQKNIKSILGSSIDLLENSRLNFDLIFVDPSRRNDKKGKVFLLEDCLPNLVEYKALIESKTKRLIVKNSPMLDIDQSLKELEVSAHVHVIAINNEVKEVLLDIDWTENNKVTCINFTKTGKQVYSFKKGDHCTTDFGLPQTYLYEPNAAIMKAGGFQSIGSDFLLKKIHPNSHLFTSSKLIEGFPGRRFEIIDQSQVNKKSLKKLIQGQKANISVRNFPMSVSQIRKKTGLKDGGEIYVFCTTLIDEQKKALICKKV
ncbi:class I SAM-dependent methyltransferase [Flavobacteriaceae bacterium]|nr:class I SAM-dependent methyltransferase [Flavobacteriaceae bacterium]